MKKSTRELLFERMHTIGGMPLLKEKIDLLNEALEQIDEDVNLLYQTYFKKDIEKFNQTGIISDNMFNQANSDTSILKTKSSLRAHQLNSCDIFINYNSNSYSPHNQIIKISAHFGVINIIKEEGNLEKALKTIPDYQYKSFKNELSEHKIKGSIHHELIHWLDDTFNNRHLMKTLNSFSEIGRNKKLKGKNVNTTKMEIQAQMGNIKQFKNNTPDNVYDYLSFNDLVNSIPTLHTVYHNLNNIEKKEWKKNLLSRMSRENLVGKNMKIT